MSATTKKVTITLTPETINEAKEASEKIFGRVNLSGFIGMLIKKEINNDI